MGDDSCIIIIIFFSAKIIAAFKLESNNIS